MKTVGWILIALGIIMIIVRGVSVPVNKTIVAAGPIKIDKQEHKWYGWPTYAGGIIAIVGVALVATSKKSA